MPGERAWLSEFIARYAIVGEPREIMCYADGTPRPEGWEVLHSGRDCLARAVRGARKALDRGEGFEAAIDSCQLLERDAMLRLTIAERGAWALYQANEAKREKMQQARSKGGRRPRDEYDAVWLPLATEITRLRMEEQGLTQAQALARLTPPRKKNGTPYSDSYVLKALTRANRRLRS